jgi:hypothetical protein
MAESDTRLETLEDEVKVLKGEVKRTLVDLRALLMREDSPLAEKALTRRAATPDHGSDNGTAGRGVNTVSGRAMADPTMEEELEEAASGSDSRSSADLPPESGLGLPADDWCTSPSRPWSGANSGSPLW